MEQKHEERLTKLESDVGHMTEAVSSLSKAVGDGFSEMRKAMLKIEENSESRASRLHERFELHERESARERQVQWPLVISAILLIIAVGGVIAGYVNMTTKSESKIAETERRWLEKYVIESDAWTRERCDLKVKLLYSYHQPKEGQ